MVKSKIQHNELAYENLCLKILINAAKRLLPLQLPSGRFCCTQADRRLGPDDYTYFYSHIKEGYVWGQHFLCPCAFLYTFNYKNNPFYRDKKMLRAIVRGSRFSNQNVKKYVFMPEWFIQSHVQAYSLIQDYLSSNDKKAWQRSLLDLGREMERRVVLGRSRIKKYTTMDIGVNPNHWAYYCLGLLRLGKLFKKTHWVRMGTRQLRQLARVQHPDGYWDEWNGPTTFYNHLHVYVMGIYYCETKDPEALKAIRRALRFHMYFTYPNGKGVETIDGRQQISHTVRHGASESHAAFSFFPEGRSYALNQLKWLAKEEKETDKDVSGLGQDTEYYARLTENLIYWQKGPFKNLPTEASRYHFRLKKPAGVRRHGPWISTFSAMPHKPWLENPFFLDRQMRFSVWHDKEGLVIAGPNTRGQPRAGTFSMSRNVDQAIGIPIKGKLEQTTQNDVLSAKYKGFAASLSLKPLNHKRFEIRAKVKDEDKPRPLIPSVFEAHVFLKLDEGDVIVTEKGGKVILSEKYFELPPNKVGRWIKRGKYRLRVPDMTRLVWPYTPYCPNTMFGYPGRYRVGVVVLFFKNKNQELKCILEVAP